MKNIIYFVLTDKTNQLSSYSFGKKNLSAISDCLGESWILFFCAIYRTVKAKKQPTFEKKPKVSYSISFRLIS